MINPRRSCGRSDLDIESGISRSCLIRASANTASSKLSRCSWQLLLLTPVSGI